MLFVLQDLIGLSSSGDALTSPVTSPNSVKKKKLSVTGGVNKKLHVQVHSIYKQVCKVT